MDINAEVAISLVCRAVARKHGRKDWREHTARYGSGECAFAAAYGEPGYFDPAKGILFANWNDVPAHLSEGLERRGFELEWSDEWLISYENNFKAYRSSPDSYGWKPYYVMTDDGDIIGGDEIESGDQLDWYVNEYLLNDANRCNVFRIDLRKMGFEQFNGDFETGFHPGQNDDPRKVMKRIETERPGYDVVFSLDSVGQFDMNWTAWIRP